MTVLLSYRPPKLNQALIPEMYNLLSSQTPSCFLAAEFLTFLDCFNLTQHVDLPTHTRGHTLDLVIADSGIQRAYSKSLRGTITILLQHHERESWKL